jgi:GAF domain-containing protein
MEAERARVFNNDMKAMKYYQKAIKLADENGNLFELALAHELAAKFYSSRNMAPVAAVYLKNAHHYYLKWGAANKTADLERRYPEILATPALGSEKNSASPSISMAQTLDLASIIKATQALSGEIVLEKLLRKLIEIVLETAGAQKVVFIIRQGEQWGIGATGMIHDIQVNVQKSVPMGQSLEIPLGIIHYVQRTKESVILDNAPASERFATDTYIASRKPKSILCVPIIHKGDLKGLLYLENNSLTGAFTGERIEILTILAAQVAISIENASLYENLVK